MKRLHLPTFINDRKTIEQLLNANLLLSMGQNRLAPASPVVLLIILWRQHDQKYTDCFHSLNQVYSINY